MGVCDRATGRCSCRSGFSGEACQRMECPSGCNGQGRYNRCALMFQPFEPLLLYLNSYLVQLAGAPLVHPSCTDVCCTDVSDPRKGPNAKQRSNRVSQHHLLVANKEYLSKSTATIMCKHLAMPNTSPPFDPV